MAPPAPSAPQPLPPPGPGSLLASGRAAAPNPSSPADYLTGRVRVAGSAGVSREQLQAKAGAGVATPTSASTETEGGFTPDPEYQNRIGELAVDERLIRDRQATEDAGEQDDLAAMYRKQYAGLAAKEAAASEHASRIQAGVAEQEQTLARTRQAFRSAEVDPQRMFQGGGGAMFAIGAAIASALGAYAATVGKTQNFAQQTIDRAIDADIRAQEANIRIKGESADNALQDLARMTGSMESAKSALRIVQMDRAQQQVAAFAADSKSVQIKRSAELWDVEFQKKLADAQEDYRVKSLGTVKQKVSSEVEYARAGTASYYRDPTDKEMQTRVGIVKTLQDVGASQAGIAKTEAETAKLSREAEQGPDDPALRKTLGSLENHKAQVTDLAKRYGYEVKDGKLVPGQDAGFPYQAQLSESAGLRTRLTAIGVTFSSIANNDAELGEAAKKDLTPNASDSDAMITQKLQAQLDYVNTKSRAVKGTSAPGAVQAFEQNQQTNAEQSGAALRAKAAGAGSGGPTKNTSLRVR